MTISRCAITNNTVTNNVASNGAFYFGGGVFSEGPAMTIDNSTITGNTCGPFGNGGGLAFFTNVTLTNSTVYGNGGNGGGNILRGGGTLTFKNNIIGGGILTGINGTCIDISGGGFSFAGLQPDTDDYWWHDQRHDHAQCHRRKSWADATAIMADRAPACSQLRTARLVNR